MWDAICVGLEPQPRLFNITKAQPYSPPAQKWNSVRGDPYAHKQHNKLLKHFVYIWYGCGIQSVMVWSLSHYLTRTLRLNHTPSFLEFHTHLHQKWNSVWGDSYAHPLHSKMLKCFLLKYHMDVGCRAWAPHLDIMCSSLRVHPYAHPPHIKVLNTWYTYF